MSNKVAPVLDGGQQEAEERELREPSDPLNGAANPGHEVGVEMIGSGISANPYAAGGPGDPLGPGRRTAARGLPPRISPVSVRRRSRPSSAATTRRRTRLSNVGRDFPCFPSSSRCACGSPSPRRSAATPSAAVVSLPGEGLVLRGRRSDDKATWRKSTLCATTAIASAPRSATSVAARNTSRRTRKDITTKKEK